MKKRQEIRERIDNVMNRSVTTGDPHNQQMRELAALSSETMLEIINSLEKMDSTNRALDKSNKELTTSNLRLQVVAVSIAILALISSIFFGSLALNQEPPTVIYQAPCTNNE